MASLGVLGVLQRPGDADADGRERHGNERPDEAGDHCADGEGEEHHKWMQAKGLAEH